jgi:hypothetical protein
MIVVVVVILIVLKGSRFGVEWYQSLTTIVSQIAINFVGRSIKYLVIFWMITHIRPVKLFTTLRNINIKWSLLVLTSQVPFLKSTQISHYIFAETLFIQFVTLKLILLNMLMIDLLIIH